MFRVLSASSPWGMPVLWCSFLGAVVQKQVLFAAWVQLSQVCCWLQLGSFPGPWAECLRVFAREFVGLMVFVVGISVGWAVLEGPPCSFGRFPSPSRLHRTVRHVFSSLLPVPIPVVRVGMVSFWPQHLPLRVKGHVPPCCNTWLAALASPRSSSLLFRLVQIAALVALWWLGAVSYTAGQATIGQDWCPLSQYGCADVPTLRGIGTFGVFGLSQKSYGLFNSYFCLAICLLVSTTSWSVFKAHSLAKLLNFSPANCGTLSLMTMSGMPCLAKWHLSFLMTVLELLLCWGGGRFPKKFEKQSTKNK